jgi:HK97 gp10 family phage protein
MSRLLLSTPDLRRTFQVRGRRAVDDFARKVQNRAKVLAPVDTGRLRASIRVKRTLTLRGPSAVVGTDVQYAPMVENGTGPHVIRPVRRKALRFKMGGRTVIVAKVNHPGTRPRPFLSRALREVAANEGWDYRR